MENDLLSTEAELVTRLKSNDRKAYEYFYDKYGPALYGVICRIVQNEDMANTVLTDTFLQLKKKLKNYEDSNRSVFLFALNISRDMANNYIDRIEQSSPRPANSLT